MGWLKPPFFDHSVEMPTDARDDKPENSIAKGPLRQRGANQVSPTRASAFQGTETKPTNMVDWEDHLQAFAYLNKVIQVVIPKGTEKGSTRISSDQNVPASTEQKAPLRVQSIYSRQPEPNRTAADKFQFPSEFNMIVVVDDSSYYSEIESVLFGTDLGNKGGQSRLVGNFFPPAGMQVDDPAQTIEDLVGYERAREECSRRVKKIIAECKRANIRYRDPGFDLDWDLKMNKGNRLNYLRFSKFDVSNTRYSTTTSSTKAGKRVSQWLAEANDFQMGMTKATQSPVILQIISNWSDVNCHRKKSHWHQPLALAAAVSTFILPAAAVAVVEAWGPHLRIGAGFAGFPLGVVPIPLRRDDRVDPLNLIPIYISSLICTALFIALQYSNLRRNRGQYLFGTFILTAHLVGGLSQTSDSTLDGIIDLGPVLLPAVAALVSLLFPRHQRHQTTGPAQGNAQRPEEADIGLQPLAELGQAVTGLVTATS
ncbi:hypothetical protein F5Y08DRAFT_89351 [Xylaria arbuscula]|nr:hypothetical protein F5Y08DRAFT_89351 [Xylaria arbuscula]